jgi:hypothetical protein
VLAATTQADSVPISGEHRHPGAAHCVSLAHGLVQVPLPELMLQNAASLQSTQVTPSWPQAKFVKPDSQVVPEQQPGQLPGVQVGGGGGGDGVVAWQTPETQMPEQQADAPRFPQAVPFGTQVHRFCLPCLTKKPWQH